MNQLSVRDPFRSLFPFPRFMEDFEDFGAQRGLRVHETQNDIVAEAVVAGVPAKDVEVHIEDGVMTIKAEKKEVEKTEEITSSTSYKYYYSIALSGGQWNKSTASVKNGVITVKVPKSEAAKPQRVKVLEEKE